MTIDQPVATRLEGRSLAWRLGASATLAIAIVLGTWALTVDFTKVSYGFFSDGATYYSLAHSIADDLDFEYRREDLVRVWREFPSGPEGIFLKRGRDVDVSLGGRFPFVTVATRDDPDRGRLYYGKSYIFPLFAAPFVFLFGTNGFLVLHAVLITLVFLAAPGNESAQIELTYNWDPEVYGGGRNFGHVAYEVDDIYATCQRLLDKGVTINRPPRDGRMAFVRSPDKISIELLQRGKALPPSEPWKSMPNVGEW